MAVYRRFAAELLGTFILVFVGCGVATITLGQWGTNASGGAWGFNGGVITTALAFGLVLAGLAYAIGPISGCHVNPAVTLGMWVARRISAQEAVGYVIAQFFGAITAAGCLALTLTRSPLYHQSDDGLGANGWGTASAIHVSAAGAFIVEVIMTAIFVFVILRVTRAGAPAALAGLVIGLTLAICHLFAIPIDGTSVNPARSFGPALFLGGSAFRQVWLFIVAPLVGGALAAGIHLAFRIGDKDPAPAS
jgi:aquaporin Z